MTEEKTLEESVIAMVSEINGELTRVHTSKYDEKSAIRAAALALKAQMDLAEFLSDVEASAKGLKNEAKIVQSKVYFECIESNTGGKKPSEAMLEQMVVKDQRTIEAETNAVEGEKKLKKWMSLFATLKEAHIFFRNLGKNDWNI